jgi:hypothetical protein
MADDIRLVIGVDDRDLIRTQKEQKKFERNLLIIESAFRKGDITAKRYTAELNKQAKQLSRLGGSYNKANSEVRKYSASLRKATDDQLRMTQATNMAGKSTNRFGMYAQQVGYQVGDFFVQVQSGTSALVAFGQQGTQLAGLLPGVAGAVIGISLAIGTMLLRSFLEMKKASKDASAGFVDYEASLKSAKEETQSMSEELMVLEGNFRSVAHAALDKALRDAEAALNKAETAEIKTRRLSDGAREHGLQVLRNAVQVAQDNLDKHLELNTTLSKTASLEEARLNSIKLFYEYRQRDADAAKKLAEAVEEIKKKQEGLNREAGLLESSLQREISMLLVKNQFGEKSLAVKRLELQQQESVFKESQDTFEIEKLREGYSQKIVDGLLEQRRVAFNLKTDLQGAADASREIARLAAMSDKEYQQMLYGQAYAQSRMAAPKTPVEGKKEPVVKESDLEKLRYQVALETELLGKTEARQRVIQAVGITVDDSFPKTVAGLEQQINKNLELVRVEQERIDLANTIGSAMEDSLMSMVDGTKSVKDAFRDMAADIVRHLYKVLVVQQMINSFGGMLSGSSNPILKTLGGGLESYGSADGGGYTGNGPRSGGLDGKGGFMMMMHPRETVIDHTKGQQANTNGPTIVQNFNFSANGDDSVKKIIAQAAPQIAQMTKNSMLNDRRRGGTTKAVFG